MSAYSALEFSYSRRISTPAAKTAVDAQLQALARSMNSVKRRIPTAGASTGKPEPNKPELRWKSSEPSRLFRPVPLRRGSITRLV
jgi:hypothetical protein